MLELYICLIASFQFLTFRPCLSSSCGKGFYGPNCSYTCSVNCRHGMCAASIEKGIEECTKGCKPGFYGSRCQVPCHNPSADKDCQKRPKECIDGFCDLGKSCVSGCVDDYYGYNCTCNRAEGCNSRCGEDCPDSSFTVNYGSEIISWIMLTFGSGVFLIVLLTVLIMGSSRARQLMKTSEHPAELGQTLRVDGPEETGASKTSGNESYIHAMPNHYDECSEEYFA